MERESEGECVCCFLSAFLWRGGERGLVKDNEPRAGRDACARGKRRGLDCKKNWRRFGQHSSESARPAALSLSSLSRTHTLLRASPHATSRPHGHLQLGPRPGGWAAGEWAAPRGRRKARCGGREFYPPPDLPLARPALARPRRRPPGAARPPPRPGGRGSLGRQRQRPRRPSASRPVLPSNAPPERDRGHDHPNPASLARPAPAASRH